MRSSAIAIVMAIAVAAVFTVLNANLAEAQDVCTGDIAKLAATCRDFVLKPGPQKDPSDACCQAIKGVDVPCVCNHLPKDIEKVISMEKVVYVAKYCGKPMKSGDKCGSFTVPRAISLWGIN